MASGSPLNVSNAVRPPSAQHLSHNGSTTMPSASPPPPQASSSGTPGLHQQPSISPPISAGPVGQQPHHDLKSDQSSGVHQTPQNPPQSQAVSKPKPPAPPKSYKIPPKESPVPLPANFLAAMSSSPGAPPSASKGPPVQTTAQPAATTGAQVGQHTASSPQLSVGVSTPVSAGSPGRSIAAKISTTPIPVPRFPGMTPHQAAARAAASQKTTPAGLNTQQVQEAAQDPVSVTPKDEQTITPTEGDVPMTESPASQVQAAGRTLEFADVPGSESMEFMERMMANLRRVVQGGSGI